MLLVLLLIIILLIIILLCWHYSKPQIPKQVEGYLNSFNGRMGIFNNRQYLSDQVFEDVAYYQDDDQFSPNMVTGWEKCRVENEGHGYCVEFGLSGDTFYFPY